ncbi:MAG TPA: hypothetical protein VK469_14810 [Candidatus Kapabacteria bacterium]|nr:hypothetical protein [Candidatus Kapabacteria bacterium]
MNLRKSSYFKPLCLLVAALFTSQCVSVEKKLILMEEKVIVQDSQDYVYELEKIKTPTNQDPTIEYRIVKFPANKIEHIKTYQKIRKTNRSGAFLNGLLGGAVLGGFIGSILGSQGGAHGNSFYETPGTGQGISWGALIGSIVGIVVGSKSALKDGITGKIEVTKNSDLGKKPLSTSIPVTNLPLEFKWKTATREMPSLLKPMNTE